MFGKIKIKIMNQKNTNWLGVIVSVVACMGLGFLWYGYLFLDKWMAGNGITMGSEEGSMVKNGVEHSMSMTPMIYNVISIVIFSLFMNWLLNRMNAKNLMSGLTTGVIIGLVMFVGIFVGNTYALNDMSLTMVDGSYSIVFWALIGAIMGGVGTSKNNAEA